MGVIECRFCHALRLNVPPYSIIRVNDRILINGRTTATVGAVRKYTQLQSVLETESLANLLPAADSASGAAHTPTLKASAAAMRHFRQFLSAVEEENHGLVVFELRVGSEAQAEAQRKTPEEWGRKYCFACLIDLLVCLLKRPPTALLLRSGLLYEQLAKKRKYGCSLADLQFAFPALSIDEIMKILTEVRSLHSCHVHTLALCLACLPNFVLFDQFQMDGVVYTVQDKYLLL